MVKPFDGVTPCFQPALSQCCAMHAWPAAHEAANGAGVGAAVGLAVGAAVTTTGGLGAAVTTTGGLGAAVGAAVGLAVGAGVAANGLKAIDTTASLKPAREQKLKVVPSTFCVWPFDAVNTARQPAGTVM